MVAVTISAPFTWSGVQSGWRARICAAIPETTGAENDVPDIQMYPGATRRSGNVVASVLADGTGPIIQRPGAPSSGFAKPSAVAPKDVHGAALSSARETVSAMSDAPTVITNGSFPGA